MGFFSTSDEPGLIATYGVVYRGGLPEQPKEKAGKIDFKVFDDRFGLLPTLGTKGWFKGLNIPFADVSDFQIVQRTVGTFEGILGGLDSKQLNQANNLHISFVDGSGSALILRLEMLSGLTVMGQAKVCLELMDRLKIHRVREKFRRLAPGPQPGSLDIPDQIAKLAVLKSQGILSEQEFSLKKAELLARM